MYNDQPQLHENMTDPLDEFLVQLLNDIPAVPVTITTVMPTAASEPESASATVLSPTSSSQSDATATATTANYVNAPSAPLTCRWLTTPDLPVVCNAPLPTDTKDVCAHYRQVHNIHGNEKVLVQCQWRDCHVAPMQRGSLIRHVLTVHLGLLRWQCEACGRKFSRKGTAHTCVDAE